MRRSAGIGIAEGVAVRILHLSDEAVREIGSNDVGKVVASAEGLVWIDFDHTEESGMAMLPDLFDVRAADVADCHVRTPVPKLHLYPDHHYSSINGLARSTDGRLYIVPLKTFQHPGLVVTILGPTSAALPPGGPQNDRRRARADRRRRVPPEHLPRAHHRDSARDDGDLRVHDRGGRRPDRGLREAVCHHPPGHLRAATRRAIRAAPRPANDRTSAAQAHQSYTGLLETVGAEGLLAVDERRVRELRHGFGQLVQTVDLEREYLQEMIDLFQTRVSTELNRFVRKVTAWGTVGLAWTVITGFYGMNVVGIPGLESPWGLPAIVASMIVIGAVLALMFRRHGWL